MGYTVSFLTLKQKNCRLIYNFFLCVSLYQCSLGSVHGPCSTRGNSSTKHRNTKQICIYYTEQYFWPGFSSVCCAVSSFCTFCGLWHLFCGRCWSSASLLYSTASRLRSCWMSFLLKVRQLEELCWHIVVSIGEGITGTKAFLLTADWRHPSLLLATFHAKL